jgi:hypothetical protein
MFRRSTAVLIALVSSAVVVSGCASDSATAPSANGVLASKSDGGGSGSGSGGGGGSGGARGGGGGVVSPPTILTGPLYLRESFGFFPIGTGTPARFDAAGNPAPVSIGKSINGFRAEFPNTGSEVWISSDASHAPAWRFAISSVDPAEPSSPFEMPGSNGVLASNNDPTDASNNAALLPFLQPPGSVTASITAAAGPYATAIGFSTAATTLPGTFESTGAAWMVLRIPAAGIISGTPIATWELHTNGVNGPSASGTIPLAVAPGTRTLAQSSHRISVTFDPSNATVVGSIDGVALRSLSYSVTGVTYVGIQGNGIVNDFRVEAATGAP